MKNKTYLPFPTSTITIPTPPPGVDAEQALRRYLSKPIYHTKSLIKASGLMILAITLWLLVDGKFIPPVTNQEDLSFTVGVTRAVLWIVGVWVAFGGTVELLVSLRDKTVRLTPEKIEVFIHIERAERIMIATAPQSASQSYPRLVAYKQPLEDTQVIPDGKPVYKFVVHRPNSRRLIAGTLVGSGSLLWFLNKCGTADWVTSVNAIMTTWEGQLICPEINTHGYRM